MTSTRSLAIVLLTAHAAVGLSGCATDTGAIKKTEETPSSVTLASSNGDLGKYIGTWVSNCGHEYRPGPGGSAALASGLNSFSFTSVSANALSGTMTVDSYDSPDCSGPNKRATVDVTLTYLGNFPVGSSLGETVRFSGMADKVSATVVGTDGTNIFNVGFLDGFNKFRVSPLDLFSSTNLVYTKK